MKNTEKTYKFINPEIIKGIESSEANKMIQLRSLSALEEFWKDHNETLKLKTKP